MKQNQSGGRKQKPTKRPQHMELHTLAFSYKKRTVPTEVDVRDNKAVLETVRQEALMI